MTIEQITVLSVILLLSIVLTYLAKRAGNSCKWSFTVRGVRFEQQPAIVYKAFKRQSDIAITQVRRYRGTTYVLCNGTLARTTTTGNRNS